MNLVGWKGAKRRVFTLILVKIGVNGAKKSHGKRGSLPWLYIIVICYATDSVSTICVLKILLLTTT